MPTQIQTQYKSSESGYTAQNIRTNASNTEVYSSNIQDSNAETMMQRLANRGLPAMGYGVNNGIGAITKYAITNPIVKYYDGTLWVYENGDVNYMTYRNYNSATTETSLVQDIAGYYWASNINLSYTPDNFEVYSDSDIGRTALVFYFPAAPSNPMLSIYALDSTTKEVIGSRNITLSSFATLTSNPRGIVLIHQGTSHQYMTWEQVFNSNGTLQDFTTTSNLDIDGAFWNPVTSKLYLYDTRNLYMSETSQLNSDFDTVISLGTNLILNPPICGESGRIYTIQRNTSTSSYTGYVYDPNRNSSQGIRRKSLILPEVPQNDYNSEETWWQIYEFAGQLFLVGDRDTVMKASLNDPDLIFYRVFYRQTNLSDSIGWENVLNAQVISNPELIFLPSGRFFFIQHVSQTNVESCMWLSETFIYTT